MLPSDSYPYLDFMLGSYFHQDAYDDGDSDVDIVKNFLKTTHPYEQLGVRADIMRFLHLNRDSADFLTTFKRVFSPDIIIGRTDAEAKAWLQKCLEQLENGLR